LMVSTPDAPCLRDAYSAARLFERIRPDFTREGNERKIQLVVNRLDPKLVKKNRSKNIDDTMDTLGLPLAGAIFEDRGLPGITNACTPLMLASKRGAALDIRDIALRVTGAKPPVRSYG